MIRTQLGASLQDFSWRRKQLKNQEVMLVMTVWTRGTIQGWLPFNREQFDNKRGSAILSSDVYSKARLHHGAISI